MAERNLYVVLGISRRETPEGIRTAYLELAKRHHPDVSGAEETRSFQEIAEAYRVLSDPDLRRRHDDGLQRPEARATSSEPAPGRHVHAHVEPLRPEPVRFMDEPEAVHPSFDAAHERFLRNFTGRGVPKSERPEPFGFDLVLTPEEAARGGLFPVAVPVFARCARCGGSGREWAFPCLRCDGQGVVESERTLGIRLPPMTREGTLLEVPLDGLGIRNLFLRMQVRIGS